MEAMGRIERRASARVAATGSVIVGPDPVLRGRIVDLSAGGVRFEPAIGEAAVVSGATCEIDIRIDGAAFGWFRFLAVISRTTASEVAATFIDVPAEFAAAIRSQLRVAAASAETPGVLVVDVDAPRRVLIAAALRAAGCHVTEVATPLESISYLEDSEARPWIVAIADTLPATIAQELRAHMRSAHALVRLVAISDGAGPAVVEITRLATQDRRAPPPTEESNDE